MDGYTSSPCQVAIRDESSPESLQKLFIEGILPHQPVKPFP